MKSLYDYEILKTVFYRGVSILEYIENAKSITELDKEAIQATIMDALVFKGCIDPEKETLDFLHLSIIESKDGYSY